MRWPWRRRRDGDATAAREQAGAQLARARSGADKVDRAARAAAETARCGTEVSARVARSLHMRLRGGA